ncbi:MAG: helix-turn-helix transcriptional regulator [Clostridiaceae bacterium]|nr:helix-turn-helix transcriptional regulator [Clostridiaceae bacterium]
MLEEIRATIEKYLEFTVTIGVGNIYHSYDNIHKSYSEAISSLGYRYTVGTNRIIFINDIEPHRHHTLIFNKEKELRLLACIKANDKDDIIKMVDTLIKDASNRAGIEQLKNYVICIIICIIREAESIGLNTEELQQLGDIRKILDLNTVKQLQDVVLNLCFSLMENISQSRQNNCSAAIEKVKCYIHEHYSDCNISVGAVSQHLKLSPSYFRAIFKKETGTTFINYLTDLRMKKAKNLIASTNMKNYEIAEAVGYSDPYYFSYCFKKHFNMSPSEYRESLA